MSKCYIQIIDVTKFIAINLFYEDPNDLSKCDYNKDLCHASTGNYIILE